MDLFSLEALGPFLWRSTTVIATGFALNLTLFRRCPSRRHATLVASLLLIPLVWITAGVEWSVEAPLTPPSSAPGVESVGDQPELVVVQSFPLPNRLAWASDRWNGPGRWLGESLHEAGPPESGSMPPLGRLLFGLWLAGALLFALRQVVRWRALRSMLGRARTADDPDLKRCLGELQKRLRAPRRIHLLQLQGLPGPCAAGIFAPVILIPDGPHRTDEIEATLAHEILHHCRHDLLFQCLGQWIRTLFWLQPLVHLALRAAAVEREKAVDLSVVDALGRPDQYAELLLRSVRRTLRAGVGPAWTVAPLGDGSSALRRRIEMLLSHTKFRTSRRPRMFAVAIGFSFCLATLFLLMTSEGQAQQERKEIGSSGVETGDPGRYRLRMGLESVNRVELRGDELQKTDWTYHADEEILEVRVPVADASKLNGFGKLAVPWVYNLERLYSDNVEIKLGERTLELGKDFTVDLETRTIRLKIDVMQGPRELYSLTYEKSPGVFTSLLHNVGQRKLQPRTSPPPGPDGLARARLVPTGRAGFHRLSRHLRNVTAVWLTRNARTEDDKEDSALLRPDIDYSYSPKDALLELKVQVDPDKDLVSVHGEATIPWRWTIAKLDADSVQITLGDRAAQRGVDFSVDGSTGTIRLLRAEDCGEDALYYVQYVAETELGTTMRGFGTLPYDKLMAAGGDSEADRQIRGPRGQPLDSAGLWSTDDPRVFVPRRPILKGAWKLTQKPSKGEGGRIEWSRGEDFLFDPVVQRLVLLRNHTIDLDTQHASLWANGIPLLTTQFPTRIDRAALRVTLNGNALEEGRGFEILEGDTCVRVLPGALDKPPAGHRIKISMGALQTSFEGSYATAIVGGKDP